MEYKVEASNSKTKKFLESLMPSFVEQLGLARSRSAVLVKVTGDLEQGFNGAAMMIDFADCILVLIRPPKRLTALTMLEMGSTLAHEMVHVRQLALGIMRVDQRGDRYWRGRRYSKKTPYLDMPWEIDAFQRQELMFRRAIEL